MERPHKAENTVTEHQSDGQLLVFSRRHTILRKVIGLHLPRNIKIPQSYRFVLATLIKYFTKLSICTCHVVGIAKFYKVTCHVLLQYSNY